MNKNSNFEDAYDMICKSGQLDLDNLNCILECIKHESGCANNEQTNFVEKFKDFKERVYNDIKPSEANPIQNTEKITCASILNIYFEFMNKNMDLCPKINNIHLFPGTYDKRPQFQNDVQVNLKSQFKDRLSTGYYLMAGETCTFR
jgi:hypothetical protein